MKLKNNTYYTKQDIAINLISKLNDVVDINSYDTILEPSAGSGVFLNIIKEQYVSKQIIALDILPQHKDITKQDFLTYNTEHIKDKNILTISNPPFSPISLLNNFLKKIFNISSVVAIILPSSFKNNHRQNLINPYFHLISGVSSSLMAHRGKFRKKTFKKSKRQCTLKYFRDAVTNVVTAL